MAVTTIYQPPIHRRQSKHGHAFGVAVAVAVIVAIVGLFAYQAIDSSTSDSDRTPLAPALDASKGPNQDLTPEWGSDRSPADAIRAETAAAGPNQDLTPASVLQTSSGVTYDAESLSAEVNRGPNQDLPAGSK